MKIKVLFFLFVLISLVLLNSRYNKIETNYYCCESPTVRWKFAIYCGECDSETGCHYVKIKDTGLLEYFGLKKIDCPLNPEE